MCVCVHRSVSRRRNERVPWDARPSPPYARWKKNEVRTFYFNGSTACKIMHSTRMPPPREEYNLVPVNYAHYSVGVTYVTKNNNNKIITTKRNSTIFHALRRWKMEKETSSQLTVHRSEKKMMKNCVPTIFCSRSCSLSLFRSLVHIREEGKLSNRESRMLRTFLPATRLVVENLERGSV